MSVDRYANAYSPTYGYGCCSYEYADVKVFNLDVKAPCAAKANGLVQTLVSAAAKRASSVVNIDTATYCSRCTCPTSSQTCTFNDMIPFSSEDRCDGASSFNAISSSTGGVFAENITVDGNQNLQTLNLGDAVAIEGFLEIVNNPYVDVVNLTNLKYVGMYVNVSNNADALLRVHAQCSNASNVDFIRDLVVDESYRASSSVTYDSHTCYSRRCRCTSYERNSCRLPTSLGSTYSYCASNNCALWITAPYLEPYTDTDVCTHSIMDATTGVFNGTLVVDAPSQQFNNNNRYLESDFDALSRVDGDLVLSRAAFDMYRYSRDAYSRKPFKALSSIGGSLQIVDLNEVASYSYAYNDPISSFNFTSLTSIGGDLDVRDNVGQMTRLKLESLTSVGGDVQISNNTAIAQVVFSTLQTVGGTLVVRDLASEARVFAPCAQESTGFVDAVVQSTASRASSEITGASIVYCVKTRCTCPASKNYCYPYELVAYSPEDVCEDVYDAGTGRIDADVVVDGNAFLSYFQFHDVKTITGSLRVVNNP